MYGLQVLNMSRQQLDDVVNAVMADVVFRKFMTFCSSQSNSSWDGNFTPAVPKLNPLLVLHFSSLSLHQTPPSKPASPLPGFEKVSSAPTQKPLSSKVRGKLGSCFWSYPAAYFVCCFSAFCAAQAVCSRPYTWHHLVNFLLFCFCKPAKLAGLRPSVA